MGTLSVNPSTWTGLENVLRMSDMVNSMSTASEDKRASPLFLPPAAFSRMDVPQDYQYRRDAASDKSNSPYNIIGRTRQRRLHHALFVTYDVSEVPQVGGEQ